MNLFTSTDAKILNPELKVIKDGWIGNPTNDDGSFRNLHHAFNHDMTRTIKWRFASNPQSEEKEKDTFRVPTIDAEGFLKSSEDGIVWIGHASFLIRINGKLIITDPIFYTPSFFMTRFSKLPFDPENIKNLDYILISHDHYDHLDKKSLELLYKNNPKVRLLSGLKTGEYCADFLDGINYQDAGWYQEYSITEDSLRVVYLPARHWGNRMMYDLNRRLWGSFIIQYAGKSIYFGGDSAWDTHFEEVGLLFGEPDFALIGVGAYKPEWFMSQAHIGPRDGLKAALKMGAKAIIPMHYGTFDLSDEPIGDPYREIRRIYDSAQYKFTLRTPRIGQIVKLDN